MLIYNKYLEELGYDKSDFPFKVKDSRYKLDKKTGIVEAQTWNLHATIVLELYTYLRNFQDEYMNYGTPIEFAMNKDGSKKKNGNKEWHKTINDIVDGLKAYIEWMHNWVNKSPKENQKTKDEVYKKFNKAWKLLGENIDNLWW